jgi:hypothetical protein
MVGDNKEGVTASTDKLNTRFLEYQVVAESG